MKPLAESTRHCCLLCMYWIWQLTGERGMRVRVVGVSVTGDGQGERVVGEVWVGGVSVTGEFGLLCGVAQNEGYDRRRGGWV